jgi:CRP/FNR family transcriptional regulator, cyclic AMP receptor protein
MSDVKFDVTGLGEATFEKGHVLLEEGKAGGKVYVLKSGRVAIVAGGNEICKVSDPMTVFGEISLLLHTNVSANVIVDDVSTFYVIDDLIQHMKTHPNAAVHVAQVLAHRVVDMNKFYVQIKSELVKIENNPAAKASKRLWDYVLKMDSFWGREVL